MTGRQRRPESGESQGRGGSAYVTAAVAEQLFGIPIERVRDVFHLADVTPVPTAPPAILGLLNLRGRVVTAIDLRRRLDMPSGIVPSARMAIGIEAGRQSYCLVVDTVGEIVELAAESLEPNPVHIDAGWAALSQGVHRIEDKLMIVIDIPAVLDITPGAHFGRRTQGHPLP